MPTSTRRSTGANGTRPDFIRAISSRWKTSNPKSRWCRKRICARRRRARRRSAIICASRKTKSSTSTAPAAPPAGPPPLPSAATIGAPSPMRTPASCGAWACGRATPSALPPSSRFTWAVGGRWPAPNVCTHARFLSAPAHPACRRAARNGSTSSSRRASTARRLTLCISPASRARKALTRAISASNTCSFPANPAPPFPACATRSRRFTARASSTAARWRKCRPG